MKVEPGGLWAAFKWPLALGVATLCGLLSALLGDGAWDALSWLLLTAPAAICLRALWPRSVSGPAAAPGPRRRP